MASFPYTMSTGSIPKFFKHVRDAGVPSKVTGNYLESVGFKSSNDRQLVSILKAIGFIDSAGVPGDAWKQYRGHDGKETLAAAIRNGYSELFDTYPDAYVRDDEAIANFVRGHSQYGARVVGFAVKTFKALCAEAEFSAVPTTSNPPTVSKQPHSDDGAPKNPSVSMPIAPNGGQGVQAATVNINIQLTLPASEDGKLYDAFFEAMKKHLLA